MKIKLSRFQIFLLASVSITAVVFLWHLHNLKTSPIKPRPLPVAETPKPLPVAPTPKQVAVHTPEMQAEMAQSDLDLSGRTQLQYVGRHPPVNINAVEDSSEDTQEHPATVDYGSPNPFQFQAHPEWAEAGTGYGLPSNEFANEVFARV